MAQAPNVQRYLKFYLGSWTTGTGSWSNWCGSSTATSSLATGEGDLDLSESPPIDMGSGEDRDLRWFCEMTIFPLPNGEKEVRTPCGLAVTEILLALTQFRPFPAGAESPEDEALAGSVLRQWCWASSMMAAMEGVGAFN